MYRIPSRRQNPQVDDSTSAALRENECPEITVASQQDAPLLMGGTKQLGILRLRQTELSCGNNVIPETVRGRQW